jgi:hypothetical protein
MTTAEIDAYASYLKGERKHEQTRKAATDYKELTAVAIVPFGLSPTETANFVRVSMTRGALGLIQTTLGITNIDGIFGINTTGTDATEAPSGFYPAVARITLIPANTTRITSGTSAFTGRPRNYLPGRSGSAPFGRGSSTVQKDAKNPTSVQTTIGDIDYLDALLGIKQAVKGATNFDGKRRISFEPELFLAERNTPSFGGTPVAPQF